MAKTMSNGGNRNIPPVQPQQRDGQGGRGGESEMDRERANVVVKQNAKRGVSFEKIKNKTTLWGP